MEKKIALPFFIFCLACMIAISIYLMPEKAIATDTVTINRTTPSETLWDYQCIDTMKTSRDKARAWAHRVDLEQYIEKEMTALVDMGANCVALGTPYDKEFLPYLKKWVQSARKHNLKIWYRGNFSSWEGWFEYPKGMTSAQLFEKTRIFIRENPDLFHDGDIFTPAPEGENGGPFNQVELDEHAVFRQFLIDEHALAQEEFQKIGKKVHTHWLSMNGGLAKRMFDADTLKKINNVATLDHYIKTAPEMGEFINYFQNTFGAKTIIGEFGAPIPEITGNMSEERQAEFIDELFRELYIHRNSIEGVNYWTLTDGSTELLNKETLSPRKAFAVVKKYFQPTIITGQVRDTFDNPLQRVQIQAEGLTQPIQTDIKGNFKVMIPTTNNELKISKGKYHTRKISLELDSAQKRDYTIILEPENKDLHYSVSLKLVDIKKRVMDLFL